MIPGVDISRWQGKVDFVKMHAGGAKFVFIKATQGLTVDSMFYENWVASKGILPRGAYCYMSWQVDPKKQAQFFVSAVAMKDCPNELPLVVDFECRAYAPGPTRSVPFLTTFVEEVYSLTRKRPMIYTSPSFWREFGSKGAYWKTYPLWIANYGVSKPLIPAPWTQATVWQYSDKGDGEALGVSSKSIDMNKWLLGEPAVSDVRKKGDCPGCQEYFEAVA